MSLPGGRDPGSGGRETETWLEVGASVGVLLLRVTSFGCEPAWAPRGLSLPLGALHLLLSRISPGPGCCPEALLGAHREWVGSSPPLLSAGPQPPTHLPLGVGLPASCSTLRGRGHGPRTSEHTRRAPLCPSPESGAAPPSWPLWAPHPSWSLPGEDTYLQRPPGPQLQDLEAPSCSWEPPPLVPGSPWLSWGAALSSPLSSLPLLGFPLPSPKGLLKMMSCLRPPCSLQLCVCGCPDPHGLHADSPPRPQHPWARCERAFDPIF